MFLSLGTHPAMGNQGGCDNVTLFFINPISDPCENSGHPVQTAKENLSALDSDQTVVCRCAIKLERLNYIH